jgi:hypothetical protein
MASGSKRGAVEVVLRWYVNKVVHYAVHHHGLLCSDCHWSCCSMAMTLLVCWYSPVADLAARRCTTSTLLMLVFFARAPYARCIF